MAAGAALAALALALPASATVLYSTSFASPTFATGALAGQDGWGVFTPEGGGSVTVQDTLTDNGEPAVDLGSKETAYYLYGPITPTGPITVSMDIYLDTNVLQILSFAAIGSSTTFNSGSVANDIAAEIHDNGRYFGAGPVNVQNFEPVSDYTWYSLAMTLDYATQTYDISIDGDVLDSDIAFCGYSPDSNTCNGAQASQFEGIEVYNNQIKSGAIYFGDVSISEVPEPTTWTLMIAGVALAGLALRRRNRPLAINGKGSVPDVA
jgi:hypothetical protein